MLPLRIVLGVLVVELGDVLECLDDLLGQVGLQVLHVILGLAEARLDELLCVLLI
jgi:hypothetical protein